MEEALGPIERLRTSYQRDPAPFPPGTELLSVDVFDTLLWRRVAKPTDAFLVLGHRLADDGLLSPRCTPERFAQLRWRAEQLARIRQWKRAGTHEVTIWEIYDEFQGDIVGNLDHKDLVELELRCERELTVGDLEIVEWCRRAVEIHGVTLVATSNTYFSADQVRHLCDRPSMADLPIAEFFCSSDFGVGKSQELFLEVSRRMQVPPERMVHVGDDPVADVEGALGRKIRPLFYGLTEEDDLRTVLDREGIAGEPGHVSEWCDPRHGDLGLTALRIRTGLQILDQGASADLEVCSTTGATVFGPVLSGFAEWVHERGRAVGVQKFLCPMREGRFLKRLLDGAAGYLASDLESQAFWISREACARASVIEGTREELSAFLNRRGQPTLEQLAVSMGLPPSSIGEFEASDFARDQARNDPLPTQLDFRAERFLDFVESRPDLVAIARETSERYRRLLVEHFVASAGDTQLVGIVDVGWNGSVQHALRRILSHEGVPIRLFGLYLFNTMPALDKVLAGGEMEAFVGDATSDPRAIDLILRSPELLEQACMSADGSLLAFTADGGVQCEENVVPAWQAEQRQHVQDGVVSFQQAWAANRRETSGNLPSLTLAAPQLRRILGRFIGYPTAKEALVFGRWRHEQNFGSTALEPLVPAATLPVLRHMTPEQLVEMPFTILYWIGGAAALCGDAMAQATFSLMTGASMPGTFSIAPPVGKTKVYFDRGGGYDEAHSIELDITTNPLGLSYLQWSGRAAGARRIRIDPADVQAIIRIDVLSLRVVDERRAETFGYRWTSADSLDELIVVGMRPIRDGFFYLDTIDAQMHIDIPVDLSADHEVTVELACQFLLAPSHLLEPTAHVLDVRP